LNIKGSASLYQGVSQLDFIAVKGIKGTLPNGTKLSLFSLIFGSYKIQVG